MTTNRLNIDVPSDDSANVQLELSEMPLPDLPEEGGIEFLQLNLPESVTEEKLNQIKEKYNMEHTIIEGDWELPSIKKACEILQPYAWSIKSVIEKSPRKIDYEIMKKYIREISLW